MNHLKNGTIAIGAPGSEARRAAEIEDAAKEQKKCAMKPFFTFYGGKWRAVPHYPSPSKETIIEPFAGSAGYAVRHYTHKVILVEKDPIIAGLWQYLIKSKKSDILALPLIELDQSVDDLQICQEAKHLIGFWINKGTAYPRKTPGARMRAGAHVTSHWGEAIRNRIANQVGLISHWTIINGDYTQAPDLGATWFIDAPYINAGWHYRQSSKNIDYASLGDWCKSRKGQVMVCENDGADWLPFRFFMSAKSMDGIKGKGKSQEALWQNTWVGHRSNVTIEP